MSFMVPGKIVEDHTVRRNRLGLVQFGDTSRPIILDLVPDAHVGDYVQVHVGFATERVSEQDAKRTYDQLRQSGELKTAEVDLQTEEALFSTRRRQKQR
jgi:hydrogenase expression/formation protein HypC